MTPACPCGIHPADCEYHRAAWVETVSCVVFRRDCDVERLWGAGVARELATIGAEIEAIVREIREAHLALVPACATYADSLSPPL